MEAAVFGGWTYDHHHLERRPRFMGEDFWPYRLRANLHTLTLLARARSLEAAAEARGFVCLRNTRVLQDMSATRQLVESSLGNPH